MATMTRKRSSRSKTYYPAFLDIAGQVCVVVGGGAVAEGKVAGLLEAGAVVRVVSARVTAGLERFIEQGLVSVTRRPYRPSDVAGAALAIAATDDRAVNEAIAAEAKERGVLVNVVDAPDLCTFIAPAVVRRGDIVFAVSTGGSSPALAKRLRQHLEQRFPPEYARVADLVAEVRGEARARGAVIDAATWNRALSDEVFSLAMDGRREEARERLLAALGLAAQVG